MPLSLVAFIESEVFTHACDPINTVHADVLKHHPSSSGNSIAIAAAGMKSRPAKYSAWR